MKTIKFVAAATLLAATVAPFAHAATQNADGTANIVAPLAMTSSAGLRFGDIAAGTSAGTVEIAVNDTKTCANTITCFTTSPTGAAAFGVTGFDGSAYSVTVPANVTLDGSGSAAGNDMTATLVGSKSSGTLTSGADSFTVGGTLTVGANQQAGAYAGTFTVTVEYQ